MKIKKQYIFFFMVVLLMGCHEYEGSYKEPYNNGTKLFKGNFAALSPSGSLFAIAKSDSVYASNIYTCNDVGEELTLIARNGQAPAFSPDGKQIAFCRFSWLPIPQGNYISYYQLLSVDLATMQERMLLPDSSIFAIDDIQWSPGGNMISYQYDSAGYRRRKIISSDGNGIVFQMLKAAHFTWAPDGQRFVCLEGMNYNMFIGTVGSDTRQAIGIGYGPGVPVWLPDGNTIAYLQVYERNLVYHFVSENMDSVIARGIPNSNPLYLRNIISPDGKKVVFTSYDIGNPDVSPSYQIGYYNISTRDTVQVAYNHAGISFFCWSTQSQSFYYSFTSSSYTDDVYRYSVP